MNRIAITSKRKGTSATVASIDNLRRAWRWLRTNPDAAYKNYFRDTYTAYAVADEENLQNLSRRLKDQTYGPSEPCKIFMPKKSGILRPYTLLTVEDQLVFQSIVNVIAEQLHPVVSKGYYKSVFGHLYAGKRGMYFYHKWQKGYGSFRKQVSKAVADGYTYAASFDLTACYDSIDHEVLFQFLRLIRVQDEVIELLKTCLREWTKPLSARSMYHGHGIPQGPLSSGLLSEVVLSSFDRAVTNRGIRYFRYVDDIRIYAKSERKLRHALVQLDLHSKTIGLFAQGEKIKMRRVTDIQEEIKSISNPPEVGFTVAATNQIVVRKRLAQLSPRLRIVDESRFKWVLGQAEPNYEVSIRLIKMLEREPHLYRSIINYFLRYKKFPQSIAGRLFHILVDIDHYFSFSASLLRSAMGRLPQRLMPNFAQYAKATLKKRDVVGIADLKSAAGAFLLKHRHLSFTETTSLLKSHVPWFARLECIQNLDSSFLGLPSYSAVLNELLESQVNDIALKAAYEIGRAGTTLNPPFSRINHFAAITLKKFNLIGRLPAGTCPVTHAIEEMFEIKVAMTHSWKHIFRQYYAEVAAKLIVAKAYFKTDATAWFNLMDTIHDLLLSRLHEHDHSLGTYQLGNIGGVLILTSGLAKKYPQLFMGINFVHELRLESYLSHAKVKKTGKATRRIPYRNLGKAKRLLLKAYAELDSKW